MKYFFKVYDVFTRHSSTTMSHTLKVIQLMSLNVRAVFHLVRFILFWFLLLILLVLSIPLVILTYLKEMFQ